ncbi:hypothetical protein RFI_18613 [Reticulomyxa filosa]|uniref:Sulfite exporter TauE/SafE family protein n=1 Tax=Reticulomyxa filosa TaxID=46433 RepID=X6MYT3_RETFI|nr:hypothetical protein RFI_18613 [Reticulomyxa filosa]|eukprot:ETO18649.1 hypothetical protein RFI_18613 [Reticulomyxa filosa]
MNEDCGTMTKYKVCSNHECVPCTTNSNCTINKHDECDKDSGHCELDTLFENYDVHKAATSVLIFLGSVVAAGGGLGGGGVFIPIFILVGGYDSKSASGLSLATIFGGSIVNLVMNFLQQHPNRRHRTLADLQTILIMEPMLLAGTSIGVLLNVILPGPILLALLVTVLGYVTYRTTKKGIEMWKQENEKRKIEQEKQRKKDAQDTASQSLLNI